MADSLLIWLFLFGSTYCRLIVPNAQGRFGGYEAQPCTLILKVFMDYILKNHGDMMVLVTLEPRQHQVRFASLK